MACTDVILHRISDPTIFDTWKTTTAAAISGLTSVTSASTLEQLETDMASTLSCAQQQIRTKKSLNSDIVHLHDKYLTAINDIKSKQEALDISKQRAALLNAPQNHTTVYESWFPLRRPLQTSTFLLLIVFSLFFFTLFFGILMRYMGIFVDLGYEFKAPGLSTPPSWLMRQLNPITMGILAVLITSLAVIIYLVTKK